MKIFVRLPDTVLFQQDVYTLLRFFRVSCGSLTNDHYKAECNGTMGHILIKTKWGGQTWLVTALICKLLWQC